MFGTRTVPTSQVDAVLGVAGAPNYSHYAKEKLCPRKFIFNKQKLFKPFCFLFCHRYCNAYFFHKSRLTVCVSGGACLLTFEFDGQLAPSAARYVSRAKPLITTVSYALQLAKPAAFAILFNFSRLRDCLRF